MAQIASKLEIIIQMFHKNPKGISINDSVLDFLQEQGNEEGEDEEESDLDYEQPIPRIESVPVRSKRKSKVKSIVPGKAAMRDPHWRRVNEEAKSLWAVRLGKPLQE